MKNVMEKKDKDYIISTLTLLSGVALASLDGVPDHHEKVQERIHNSIGILNKEGEDNGNE